MSKSTGGIYNVESISAEQLFRGRARYLVHWEGHSDVTWQYASTIDHTPAFASYMKAKKKRIVSISDSRTDNDGLHYRVSYTQGDDIWEPVSFVKGTKALKAFREQRKSDALESDSVSSASNSTSTPSVASNSSSTASTSTSAPSLSSLASDSVERVARISNHRFCKLEGVEYFVTWTSDEQTWVHSESLNLVGGRAATEAYIHALVADADPVKVLRKRDDVLKSVGRQLRCLDSFLPSTSEARDQFRACTSSWKLASMLSHEALLLAQEEQSAFLRRASQTSSTSQLSTPATSSRLPKTFLHSSDEYRAFTTEDALDLVQRGGDRCFQEMGELVAVRGIAWLNKCRDRFGWGMAHYAAAGPLNGSNKSLEDGPRFLKWLYDDHGAMNQLTGVEHAGVAVGSTCLHVAVALHQLKCLEFLLTVSDDSFVGHRNKVGMTAPDMVVPLANEFTAWEKRLKAGTAAAVLNEALCGFCATRTADPPLHSKEAVDRLFSLSAMAARDSKSFVPCDDCRSFFGRSAADSPAPIESKP